MASEVQEKGGSHDRARIVRRYLSALDVRKPGRTTARTVESVQHRMHQIDTLLLSADPVQRLHLTQERIDLHAEQLRLQQNGGGDVAELEKAFIRVARSYGDRHDITYSAWRQVGVDADVLAKAGIHQQAKPPRAKAEEAPKAAEAAPPVAAAEAAPPVAEKKAAAKKDTAKKAAEAPAQKKPPVAKKAAANANGATPKKAAVKKKAPAPQSEQQQLPAEAHLLS